jgi:hypothetical protein
MKKNLYNEKSDAYLFVLLSQCTSSKLTTSLLCPIYLCDMKRLNNI